MGRRMMARATDLTINISAHPEKLAVQLDALAEAYEEAAAAFRRASHQLRHPEVDDPGEPCDCGDPIGLHTTLQHGEAS